VSNHDEVGNKAILPAATADHHHNVSAHFLGEYVAGIDGSSLKQNPAYEPCSTLKFCVYYTYANNNHWEYYSHHCLV
jgi:hypothetical protein